MSTAVPTTGWSATITLPGVNCLYTATPGANGSLQVQWSANGTAWTDFTNDLISTATVGSIPASAVYLRATAIGSAGTLDYSIAASDALTQAQSAAVQALVARTVITADDTGTTWLGAPALLSFSAALASGSSTTVLLEVRDSAGTVTTAATITADTVGQTLRQALLMRQQSSYRFRRSSGTGSVTITV